MAKRNGAVVRERLGREYGVVKRLDVNVEL